MTAADPGPPPAVRELAALLRAAGLDPSAGEIADALWLAGRTRAAARAADGALRAPVDPSAGPGPDRTERTDGGRRAAAPPDPGPPRPAAPGEEPVDLVVPRRPGGPGGARQPTGAHADPEPGPEGVGGFPVRVPTATALPRILDIQRALRALQRRRPPAPRARTVLDETATAEASARALGLVVPVLRAETRRENTMRLVLDASPSMAVWQDMFDELRAVCERLGAFRDVQVHYLHRLADGTPAVGSGPEPGGRTRSADQLRDPTGRGLTMVVSDCTGPLWREGAAQRLLYRWAQCTPCVVVQPLPQRLWSRSWLPTERGTLARGGGDERHLEFRSDRPPRPGRPTGGLTVPVLPPSARALGAWARLVAGLGSGPVPAEVGRVLADHPAAPVPLPRAARPPRELVRRFRSSASPRAVQLAVYLSATPLTLPVMRLVQRTMLPDSEPSDLAEVLLSGLLRRSGPAPGQWYEFVPGVQDVLLGPLGRDDAALVLKHCSEYVMAHFGRGVRNFPALAVAQLTGVPAAGAAEQDTGAGEEPGRLSAARLPQAFAQVSAKVVRRYLPGPPDAPPGPLEPAPGTGAAAPSRTWAVRTARIRLAAYDRDHEGGRRGLYEAVAVLRRAASAPAGPADPPGEAEFELAGALLRLWGVQRDPELLTEAERTARAVSALPGMVRARALLGRVLYERAVAALPGSRPEAEELLTAAEREFAAVGAVPELERELLLDCAIRRARTLMRLCELRDDPAALRDALTALEVFAGAERAAGSKPDGGLQLALGRVLLALADREEDPAGRIPLAERAAARLAAGLASLTAPAAGADLGAEPAPGAGAGQGAGSAAGAGERGWVRVELARALRYLPERLDEAPGVLERALAEATGEPELRLAALVCLARVHRARNARDGGPAGLDAAAEAYGRARRLIPRDGDAYGELLPEWGDVLLERARGADGRRFVSTAVRVLRDSRAAVPQSDPRAAHRLLRLATGLRLRHSYEGDLVDLREAEYLLELAVRHGRGPLAQAHAWREHGDVQQEIHAHTRAPDRLDRAADSYRRAWRAAMETDGAGRTDAAVQLAARVQELRGEVLERLARPRAALDAFRAALELWQRLPEADTDRRTAVRARVRALEASL
ncbi:SAV_2336 N-terminal domain-related protein [Streptomyces sp. G-G2]|uniref:SAV_2336 N-terminal domain-related protein n=1 Tax=Streptomyces sp. G-G2 TaxID=3046201 RepID=UPI0024B8BFD5|nr:SAV_2336 N-terminal domain-related protein [Streptomyces sp. G-G2]MDJ0379294.1 SAV_2336 N-terminal domain-related protein [Streptomyces sp. G-G2]